MDFKKIFALRHANDLLYVCVIAAGIIFSAAAGIWWLAAILAAGLISVIALGRIYEKLGLNKMAKYVETFSAKIRSAEAESMTGFPFPVAVLSPKGKILWYNKALQNALSGELLFQRDIKTLIASFDIEGAANIQMRANLQGASYEVLTHRVPPQSPDEEEMIFAYFIDVSKAETIEKRYEEEKYVEMIVFVDNYEEAIKNVSDEQGPGIASAVERALLSMAAETEGTLKRLERDRYFLVLPRKALDVLARKRFPILETVREIAPNAAIAPTLSIGIGVDGGSMRETDSFARAALDMALGRGGDQVVLKDADGFKYFGGRTKEVEKRTKVKARVVAHALRELAAQNEQIIIMGHKNADIDCVGAGIGLISFARANNIKAHMVFNMGDPVANEVVGELKKEGYSDVFITPELASEKVNEKTLLIIVDTHRKALIEAAELLNATEQTVVIDHHRKGADHIENAVLLYHEPYASSACEMVTEMLQYMSDKQTLQKLEAMALYAGITLDTKGFTFKTGVRTLEAAAYLRRCGADPVAVKSLFKSDLEAYVKRVSIVASAQIYRAGIAIAAASETATQTLAAQAADEMLNIQGITTSFAVAHDGSKTVISARSTGAVNVQLVLEKLDGGGHMTVAGVQLEKVDVEDAVRLLKIAIDEYFREE